MPSNSTTLHTNGLSIQGFVPPLSWADFKLAAFDMDSTLISIECIDEIAAVTGKKAEVAAITEASMRGELADFTQSLMRRLQILAGTPASALETVARERLRYNPGARELMAELKRRGLKTLLVSGGFTYFTRIVAQELGMDFVRSNELEIADGRLTGHLLPQAWGSVCDGEQKRQMVEQTCAQLGITPAQAIAVGDGANDLPMMRICGLSVAYHAKPKVQAEAKLAINHGGLERVLEVFSAST